MPSASTAQFDENVASPWALTGGAAGAATNGALPSDAAAIGSEEQELGAGEGGERRFNSRATLSDDVVHHVRGLN